MKPLTRLLCVDDDEAVREIVQLSLSIDPTITVRVCASGEIALEDARRHRPDLILLDFMMPVLDGPTTLALMRNDSLLASIPVVFATAKDLSAEITRYRSLGVIGVIAKPFRPQTLLRDIRAIWDRTSADAAGPTSDLDTDVAQLTAYFQQRLTTDIAHLASLETELSLEDNARKRFAVTEIMMLAHRIRGSAGTYGESAVGEAAGKVEDDANALLASDWKGVAAVPTDAIRTALRVLYELRTPGSVA